MTTVVGITGGIGAGKTTLSEHLKRRGFLVHESDSVVSKMYTKPKKSFKEFIKKNISYELVKNKKIDKKKLTEIIFNNNVLKKKLEKHIHTEVRLSRKDFIQKNKKIKKNIIFVDIPLLLENNLEHGLDLVVCIISSKKNRTKRILKNKKFNKKTLNKVYRAQTSDKDRRRRSQIIISNNKTKKDFIFNAEQALMGLLK